MYAFIRIILLIIIVLFAIVLNRRLIRKKIEKILVLILCIVLSLILVIFPFENLFYSFSSPEKLFNYISTDKIIDVAYGNNSCMIYYQTDKNSYSYTFSERCKDGYKILNCFSYKKVYSKLDSNGSFYVYNIVGTKDFYVLASINSVANIEVYDGNGFKIKTDIKHVMNTNFIFFSVTNLTDEHYLLINAKKVKITRHREDTGDELLFSQKNLINQRTVP